jgi:hypothetical protein
MSPADDCGHLSTLSMSHAGTESCCCPGVSAALVLPGSVMLPQVVEIEIDRPEGGSAAKQVCRRPPAAMSMAEPQLGSAATSGSGLRSGLSRVIKGYQGLSGLRSGLSTIWQRRLLRLLLVCTFQSAFHSFQQQFRVLLSLQSSRGNVLHVLWPQHWQQRCGHLNMLWLCGGCCGCVAAAVVHCLCDARRGSSP